MKDEFDGFITNEENWGFGKVGFGEGIRSEEDWGLFEENWDV